MTVYSIQGSRIQTNADGFIVDVRETHLDFITRVGSNTLETAYLDPEQSAAVSLSDYNLVFDGKHINDSVLPDQIELFNLQAQDGSSVKVMNFVFATDHGMVELMYSVGAANLPEFRSPAEASAFFNRYEPVNIFATDDMALHLDQIAGVQTHGVFANLKNYAISQIYDEDSFDFFEQGPGAEIETWQIEQEALVAQRGPSVGQLMPDGEMVVDTEPSINATEMADDPGLLPTDLNDM